MKIANGLLAGLLVTGLGAPAWAQVDTSEAQRKLLSRRAAEADAYRKLAESVKGLQIDSHTFVRDFVAESDVIRGALDDFIKGVRLGEPRWYADLSCEVPAEVTVQRVVETLQQIHERYYKGSRITGRDFEQIEQHVERRVIKVVGVGAPREDLPPDLPQGVIEQLGGPPLPPEAPVPDLWLRIGPQARLMARQAAEMDAKRKLVERILGLRVDSQTVVRDFVTESDTINTVAQGTLIGHTVVRVFYHHDEPICEVTVEVPVESVINTVRELEARRIKGSRVRGMDVNQVQQQINTRTFQATGMGIPPQRMLAQVERATQSQYPDWARAPLRMTGNGVPPADKRGTPQGELLAVRAAEMDAKRRLAEHIHGLRITATTSVRDFVTEHDEIASYLNAVLMNATVERTSFDGEVAEATVSVPGLQVWQVINERRRSQGLGG